PGIIKAHISPRQRGVQLNCQRGGAARPGPPRRLWARDLEDGQNLTEGCEGKWSEGAEALTSDLPEGEPNRHADGDETEREEEQRVDRLELGALQPAERHLRSRRCCLCHETSSASREEQSVVHGVDH